MVIHQLNIKERAYESPKARKAAIRSLARIGYNSFVVKQIHQGKCRYGLAFAVVPDREMWIGKIHGRMAV